MNNSQNESKTKYELSPMMKHYLKIKDQHKDTIVFYRLGDFYEMFFDDAIKASKLLDLTLTGRDCGLENRAPMCGVPFHAADMYIDKLVSLGEKVAICEQITQPKPGKKELVERSVIKVVTAGTVTNVDFIDEKSNNFLACVYVSSGDVSIAWADITTGEFFAKTFNDKEKLLDLFNHLIKINPAEIICNRQGFSILIESPIVTQNVIVKPHDYIDSEFDFSSSTSAIKTQLKINSIKGFFISENDPAICSSGALISYLRETQKNSLLNINCINYDKQEQTMMLDLDAVRNLELIKTNRDQKRYGSLLWLLDKTKTSMGARKLQSYLLTPLSNIDKINYRLNAVEDLYNNTVIRKSLTELLASLNDIGRITGKISNNNLAPRDCVALYKSLELIPTIKFRLYGLQSNLIQSIANELSDYEHLVSLLRYAIVEYAQDDKNKDKTNFKYIKSGFNKELDELRELYLNSYNAISNIENQEKENTGIKNLRIGYNRVFGYYIEVTNSFKDKVPYYYIRRQTLSNAERYITEQLKDLESKILSAEDSALSLEAELYNQIKETLCENVASLQKTTDLIAELDIIVAFANLSRDNNYVRPNIVDSNNQLKIVEGRHPVIEATSKGNFIPNDCLLDSDENRTMIITGPNMAGKSTFMRQTALISIMAQIGCFVPAKSATIPLIDKIYTRIGASDSLISDQSTFMVEMTETANILKNATEKSLIILDEIGRGTSTYDGLSIAWAVLEHVTSKIKSKTLFATHYHELTEIEGIIEGVKNYKITVRELNGSIIFMRKIMRGRANKSFGIEVAELAGVSKDVTFRAKEILRDLEDKKLVYNADDSLREKQYSEIEETIKDLDLDNLSPIQAFNILADLYEKTKGK